MNHQAWLLLQVDIITMINGANILKYLGLTLKRLMHHL